MSEATLAMIHLLKKYAFFIFILISTITLDIIGWYVTANTFIPSKDPGDAVNLLDIYRTFFSSFKILMVFINLSFLAVLVTLLIFINKIEPTFRQNIYFSLIYLIMALIFIMVVFP
jgi:hypothetical protein